MKHARLDTDIVVVGGGVVGTALAYFASCHTRRVVVLESAHIGGGGATAASRGIVRSYDAHPRLHRLASWGNFTLRHWRRLGLPGAAPFRASGCLTIAAADRVERMLSAEPLVDDLSRPVLVESPARWTPLRSRPGLAAVLEPDGGYGDPSLTARQLMWFASERGAEVREGTAVLALERDAGRSVVHTSRGSIRAALVLLAAGAWSRRLAPELDTEPRRIPLAQFVARPNVATLPVINYVDRIYTRPTGGHSFVCGVQGAVATRLGSVAPGVGDDEHARRVAATLRGSYRAAIDCVGGWVGVDGYTESGLPHVGWLAERSGVYTVTGLSGGGYKYAVPLADAVVAAIMRRPTFLRGNPLASEFEATVSAATPPSIGARAC